ncbi:hypothetical protein NL676_001404 [Syzygium grande]|nr:hypothetical protein NL676_001404 [Syzygium grande]
MLSITLLPLQRPKTSTPKGQDRKSRGSATRPNPKDRKHQIKSRRRGTPNIIERDGARALARERVREITVTERRADVRRGPGRWSVGAGAGAGIEVANLYRKDPTPTKSKQAPRKNSQG